MNDTHRDAIHFPSKDRPLREDVSVLGAMVGEMLREQGGEKLFDEAEKARLAAIARREGTPATDDLAALTSGLPAAEAQQLVGAFSAWFQVVNLAERVHRIRRRRDWLRDHDEPQPRGLHDTLRRLSEAGLRLEQVEDFLASLQIQPVFTAHPTEATRRTLLEKHQRLARHLVARLDPSRTPQEEYALLAQIRSEITASWQTLEHPSERMRVRDELEHVLFFVTDVIYRVVPPFYEELEDALVRVFGEQARDVRVPLLIRFATWVGGDMDGNPNVGAPTIRDTLAEHRRQILRLYIGEVRRLAGMLSQSVHRVGISEEVRALTQRYERLFPEIVDSTHGRHRDMYYRRLLRLVAARLELTLDDEDGGYENVTGFFDDLRRIARSLRDNGGQHAGLFVMRRLLRRVETFGFHLATLDLRQDAMVHRELIGRALGEADWLGMDAADRAERLRAEIASGKVPDLAADKAAQPVLEVFREIRRSRARYGRHAIGPFIVSMTQGADDVLSVLLLARWGGLVDDDGSVPLDVAPLLETVDDLRAGPAILQSLLSDPHYRAHLGRRSDCQTVMIGYSDSNKDGGLAASRWALRSGECALVEIASAAGIGLTLFHGRGGTISRGGSKTYQAVMAAPPGAVAGRLRMTEQGEIINAKYGLRGIAMRTLEETAGSAALASFPGHGAAPDTERARRVMETVSGVSRRAYRGLVYESEGFVEYFHQATPIDVIQRMQIGSRPASRRSGGGIDNLRAIPWVFAWTQARQIVPGWFGVGTGLAAAIAEHGEDTVRELAGSWPFFVNMIDDVQMVLAKSDMEIAERYAQLAEPHLRGFFSHIRAEYDLTLATVLSLRQTDRLLADDYALQRSIRLRNPYVDPLSLMQIDLLERWRADGSKDGELLQALFASVNGIARGFQNTG